MLNNEIEQLKAKDKLKKYLDESFIFVEEVNAFLSDYQELLNDENYIDICTELDI